MRWKNGHVSLVSLKTRNASVQECNGVESVYKYTKTERDKEKDTTAHKDRERQGEGHNRTQMHWTRGKTKKKQA